MHPELFKLPFMTLTVKSYGLLMVIGFILAVNVIRYLSRDITPDPQLITNAALYSLIAGVIGARLFYVIHYFDRFKYDLLSIFAIWKGGLELLGGVLLAITVIILYTLYHKLPIRRYLDILAIGLVVARLSGVTALGAWGVTALYAAMVAGVTGISIFALGSTFNYLVSLFYKQPIRQGLFGRPLFTPSIDHYFGWIGAGALLSGLIIGITSVILGISGWSIDRLWLYLLGSAMFILMGVQLILYWILMRVLDELSQRETLMMMDKGLDPEPQPVEQSYQPVS